MIFVAVFGFAQPDSQQGIGFSLLGEISLS
jgi:hypothetical protein